MIRRWAFLCHRVLSDEIDFKTRSDFVEFWEGAEAVGDSLKKVLFVLRNWLKKKRKQCRSAICNCRKTKGIIVYELTPRMRKAGMLENIVQLQAR